MHSRTDDFSLDSGAHSVPKNRYPLEIKISKSSRVEEQNCSTYLERSDSEAVAKGLLPTIPDMWNNVLLYRYDMKILEKEPPLRLLISKGNFFSRTPCSFCSSKVVWIG